MAGTRVPVGAALGLCGILSALEPRPLWRPAGALCFSPAISALPPCRTGSCRESRSLLGPPVPPDALGAEDTVTGTLFALLEELGSGCAMWALEPDLL